MTRGRSQGAWATSRTAAPPPGHTGVTITCLFTHSLFRRSRRGPRFTAVPAQESNDEDKEGGDLSTGITFASRSSKYNCSTRYRAHSQGWLISCCLKRGDKFFLLILCSDNMNIYYFITYCNRSGSRISLHLYFLYN